MRPASARPARSLATRLTPLMAALAAAWPLLVAAQQRPAANTVPVPSASWRVQGSGAAAPVNRANSHGGVDQTITQDSQKAIYQWQRFDIGANSSVNFDMKLANASALNRVLGSTAPSQIFGKLSATNGGEIYLINANGILFGRGAQVNTGSLIASALNISDAEFNSGLTNNLLFDKTTPAFRYDGTPENFIDAKNFVRVEDGAQITTANGGRVFLFAKRVENGGQISTPGGQTMLAGGGAIYLQSPDDQIALYASESNPSVPTLRGLLVEVGGGPGLAPEGAHGSAANLATGVISTPRGNATLVGMAVNQMGRVSATTSVTENGSIILRAQGAAQSSNEGVRATRAGALVLGAGSQTTIAADDGRSQNDGQPLTSDGNATFVNPRIDLAGQSVLLDRGAQVVAPGATVDVRAERTPSYAAYDQRAFTADGAGDARIVLADGALIDVSGLTTATDSVSRYFVTTELLGSNDLKDAPLQKDGLLFRSKATIDVREDSAILGSLESYREGIQQSIEERLSAGGEVRLTAGRGVLTHANSRIDVSGGQVNLTAADVRETQLIGANGQVVDLNDAPADQVYSSALNLQRGSAAGYDRWGVKVNFGALTPTHHEEGYVEGRAAGSVRIVAPRVVLEGVLDAQVVNGTRQQQGQDTLAPRGSFSVGAVSQNGQDFNSATYGANAVLDSFNLSTLGPQDTEAVWDDPLTSVLPAVSGMKRDLLLRSGFGQVAVVADGNVSVLGQSASATLDLGDQATLRLLSLNGDVTLGGATTSAAGRVELISKAGDVSLAAGSSVDLAGRFINAFQDGPSAANAITGGSFSASGNTGVNLSAGTRVDVSGGALVDATGKTTGGNAGAISLAHTALLPGDAPGLTMDGQLRGASLATGGSLTLTAPVVQIGGSAVEAGVLTLDPTQFTAGGFSSYSVDGRRELSVAADTALTLRRDEFQIDPRAAVLAPSGTPLAGLLSAGPAPGVAPAPMQLSLRSSGTDAETGSLTVGTGARIETPALSSVTLSAANRLLVDGEVHAAGGNIALAIDARQQAVPGVATGTTLWVGEHARLDVSGQVILAPATNGLRQGSVLAGGRITLAAKGGSGTEPVLVLQQGAQLDAAGASAVLDRAVLTDGGIRWQRGEVASNGGSVAIEANRALVTEGRIDLHAGGAGASGGSLAVTLTASGTALGPDAPENQLRELRVAAGPTTRTAGIALGDTAAIDGLTAIASVSTALVKDSGAANLTLEARDAVRFLEGADLALDGTLTLASRSLAVQPDQAVQVAAGQVVLRGVRVDSGTQVPVPVAREGSATLELQSRGGMLVTGDWVTTGIDQLTLKARGDLMLQGASSTVFSGSLATAGDLAIEARQVYPGTQTHFEIDATGRDVSISRPDGIGTAESPLSAGGQLVVDAATITQGGTVRAPQGRIELRGNESVTLGAGSQTSVSAAGLVLPYGSSAGGRWLAPDRSVITATPGKRVDLLAPEVAVSAGASVDLGGGGDLVAYEFVPGRGGSTDVFAGGNGAYALVPGVHTAASYDPTLAGAAALGRQIEIGAGAPLPAGTYTLLPARYALQPGAYLVEPVKASTPLAIGTVVAQADGSAWIGARLRTEGTGAVDAFPSTWRLSSAEVARQRTEIRATSANAEFAARAAAQGVVAPERPADAGTFSLDTVNARLEGQITLAGATGQVAGRGGRAEFVAGQIVVGDAAADGALRIGVATLNGLGAQTVVLGARSGVDGGTELDVGARTVTLAGGEQALSVPDLVVAATEEIRVEASSTVVAAPVSGTAPAPIAYALAGDGAALRVSNQGGATLSRSQADGAAGVLQVGEGSRLDAGAGSLLLDATRDTRIAASATLHADELTLGARAITIGGPLAGPGVLALTPRLLDQVSQAGQLTLHAYQQINLKDGAVLGEDERGTPTLDRLVLDTPNLRVAEAAQAGARITAGEITLTDSGDTASAVATAGAGHLTLSASTAAGGSGDIRLADGSLAVNGAASLVLNADHALALAGRDGRLVTAGDLHVSARGIVAEATAAGQVIQADGKLTTTSPAGSVAPASALGGSLTLQAASLEHGGRVVLPSGEMLVDTVGALTLREGSRIDVAGSEATIGDAVVALPGGRVSLGTAEGDLAMHGGVINVSGAGTAAGGRLLLAAPQGLVEVRGQLRGTSGGADGAELTIDSGERIDVAALARRMGEADPASFAGAISLRQRSGDLELGALTTLSAHDIALSADAGAVTVRGTLDARGADGGRIELSAHDGLTLAPGSVLNASATADDGEGGRIALASAAGTLRLQDGARIELAGGALGESGRLLLQARRLGVSDAVPSGTGVDIAPLQAEINGAGRIDVEAVKVYEGVSRVTDFAFPVQDGTLLASTLAADGRAFAGTLGGKADLIAARLADGDSALESLLRIHAGAEIRSDGDLSVELLGGAWSLASESTEITQRGGNASHVGDSTVTLRAAGDLAVRSSIDAGSHFGVDSAAGGSLRFVAGGDLRIGKENAGRPADLKIVTSTGDIVMQAGGDVNLVTGRARAYSTGRLSDDPAAIAARQTLLRADVFRVGAGDIRVEAGESVRSRAVTLSDNSHYADAGLLAAHPSAWARSGSFAGLAYWTSQPDASGAGLQHGVASFGGGRVEVTAGIDIDQMVAASPSSGFIDGDGAHRYGGGSVRFDAGRDVVGGLAQAGGRDLQVQAGRDIALPADPDADGSPSALILANENTAVRVGSRRDLQLGALQSSHALNGSWISGLEADASARVVASAGDLGYQSVAEPLASDNASNAVLGVLPTQVTLAAPQGSIAIGRAPGGPMPMIQQAQGAETGLDLLAQNHVEVAASLQVNASWTQGVAYHDASGQDTDSLTGEGLPGSAWLALAYNDLSRGDGAGLDRSDRHTVRVVAAEGDLTVSGAIRSARPVALTAGRDIAFTGNNVNSGLEIQHQAVRLDAGAPAAVPSELSVLQAGRDIVLGNARIRQAGPGDLLLLAGRDIDLGRGQGLQAVGNVDNSTRLPAQSAQLSLVAGLRADGADLADATRRGFAAIGAAALRDRAGDVYALLNGQGGTLGSAEALAFDAADLDSRLAQVRTLLGEAVYDASLVSYVRSLPGHAGDSDAAARQAFDSLSAVKRDAAPGALLAEAFGHLPQAERLPFIAQVATRDAAETAKGLLAFMQSHEGRALSLADALAAFEALPVERQMLRLSEVLVDEVRQHGRAAVGARLADDKEAAYDRGYAAIDTLFPLDRPSGDINLPSTQVRTLQGSGITLLAPGGGINAGETGGTSTNASSLGVVTVAGGGIAGVARDDILVNQSRIFTLAQGDILLWSSLGDVDAGRGAKTVVGAPPPVFRLDANGRIVVDTSGSFSGSGIAALSADSALDLYAPAGAIDAGEAGIRALGTVTLGADVIRGADDIRGGSVQGAPPAAPTVGLTAGLASAADAANTAQRGSGDDEEEQRRKRRARRSLLLEFLGFGRG
ncbi:MAG: filamentous hemagglutinin family protein [Vitreoscilla sp.]|nr:filamentous hemagglutinin family protein [Vitreoscilla sp.]